MPTYVYEIIETGERIEVLQGIDEPSLTRHPISKLKVRKVFLPPNLGTKHTQGATSKTLDNKNIESAGFSKYVKDKSTGKYYKEAGKQGPTLLG